MDPTYEKGEGREKGVGEGKKGSDKVKSEKKEEGRVRGREGKRKGKKEGKREGGEEGRRVGKRKGYYRSEDERSSPLGHSVKNEHKTRMKDSDTELVYKN